MPLSSVWIAFRLTVFAGLATGVGSALAFFAGIAVVGVIDKLIPSFENPHEPHMIEEMGRDPEAAKKRALHRMGLLSALAIYGLIAGMVVMALSLLLFV